jgi:phosphatidylglycerophosphate synthase
MKAEQSTEAKVLRRPIRARDTAWAATIARALAAGGLRPNHISLLSVVFGAIAGICLMMSGRSASRVAPIFLLLGAAAGMQLRLLCNLFDGMVAVEGGFKTKSGEVFNELPDRFSDVFIFVGAGYSLPNVAGLVELGWTAALLAVLTAYVRAFGGAAGVSQYFCGPMAKQQRMAVMTAACLLAAVLRGLGIWEVIPAALALVCAGCLITIWRRTQLIVRELESK